MGLLDRFKKKPKSEADVLVFRHDPFKLAVMQRLMYELELLGNKYTGGDAYFERYEDAATASEEESLRRLEPYIARGWQFFREFPIPRSLAERVDTLCVGVESDVYYQINPQWLDFEEAFENGKAFQITDISEEEIRQFPNLKTILFNMEQNPPEELVKKLESWGISVTCGD